MAAYIQSISLTRRVEDDPDATPLTKSDVLFDAMKRAMELGEVVAMSEFEVTAVDTWKVRIDKDGDEGRVYDE